MVLTVALIIRKIDGSSISSSTGLFLNVSNIVVGVENHTNFGCAASLETDGLVSRY
jgi:hypothetical protein